MPKQTESQRQYQAAYRAANKDARREGQRQWRIKNASQLKSKKAAYYAANAERFKPIYAEYRARNKEKVRATMQAYYRKHSARLIARQKEYKKHNVEHRRELNRQNERLRCKLDPAYRIRKSIALRIRLAVKRNAAIKANGTMALLGCDIPFLKEYIAARFTSGMTWDNWGLHGWHIDHRIPCAAFNLLDPEQQKRCFHYTNLQPMWHKENLSKHSKMPAPHQAELI